LGTCVTSVGPDLGGGVVIEIVSMS
jgi:hypothetical protein